MGRSGADFHCRAAALWDFASDYITDSYRNLFYGSDAFSADSPVPGYVQALVEKKQEKNSLSSFSDTDRFDGNPCRYGKSGRCCCGNSAGGAGAVFWMWVTAIIGHQQLLLKRHWHSFIKKKIRCTEVTAAVRRIIFMHM